MGGVSRRPKYVTAPNLAAIGRTVVEKWRRWPPSAILYLWWVCLDHPRRAFGGRYRCAKIWLESTQYSLIICMFVDFTSLAGKRLFTPQKLFFLGGRASTKPPKGTSLRRKTSCHIHMTYRSSKPVHRCDLCAWRRDQKEKKRKKERKKLAATLRGSRPGVQSASLIMTPLMTS